MNANLNDLEETGEFVRWQVRSDKNLNSRLNQAVARYARTFFLGHFIKYGPLLHTILGIVRVLVWRTENRSPMCIFICMYGCVCVRTGVCIVVSYNPKAH